ncbi:tape measure protein [Plantactinospora solaniradicis]|uniref:Tape measure protein n=1 Tax=Plantactinospora solaniradicis TaxID=1723736 RepID=A0ABW1KIC6_9ACTN
MAADGTKIGEGFIEIGTEFDPKALKRSKEQIEDHLKKMGSAASREWTKQNRDLLGKANNQFQALYKGQAQGVFKRHRAEIKSAQALDRQRQASLKKSIQASLQIDKAHRQALIENQRRTAAATSAEIAHQKARMRAIVQGADAEIRERAKVAKFESQTMAASKKAHDDYIREQTAATRRMYAEAARASGGPTSTRATTSTASSQSLGSWLSVGKNLDRLSDGLGQISTRIGIAAFQMQMLGVMLHQAITGPALQGFVQLSTVGLQFAVNVDYARASLKALLGPAADVEQILNDIKQITIESPLFAADDAIKYAQQLAAVGVKGNELVPTMQAMSNIFLTQGVAGPERATLAMLAYTQILSKGAIGMDDLRQQFAEHVPGGIKIFEAVAKRLGYKSIKSLSDAMKDGEVSAARLNAEFIEFGNTSKFVEGGAKAAETLGGVWQSLKEEVVTRVGSAFDENRFAIIRAINSIKPVLMQFIDWFVKSIPDALAALQRLIDRVRDWKAAYDALTPAQQENVRLLGLLVLAAGPASVALGILGTALSTVANAASLLVKVLGFAAGGGAISAVGTAALVAVAAIGAVVGAVVWLYNSSEQFRKAFLQIGNQVKDVFVGVILPMVDYLLARIQELWNFFASAFESMGLKTEHLSYLLYLLAIPILTIIGTLGIMVVAVEAIRYAFLAVYGVLDLIMEAVSAATWLVEKLAQAMALLPGPQQGAWKGIAEELERRRKGAHDFFNTPQKWRGGEVNDGVTDGLGERLKGLDLTNTGLSGFFEGWGKSIDGVTQKEIALEQAINNARRAMDSQTSATAGAVSANDNYKRSRIALTESVKRNKQTLSDDTTAGLANRDALKMASQASYELMLQQIKSGVPYAQAIKNHKDRTAALIGEFGKAKEVRTEAQKLVDTYGKVPKDVKTLLGLMGYKDVNDALLQLLAKQRAGQNATSWTLEYSKLKRASANALNPSGYVSGYATGGLIRGPGGPTGDKIPAMLSDREYVIRASSAQGIGTRLLDYINANGQLPAQYAEGGSVKWPYNFDVSKFQIPAFLGGSGAGGGIGTARMMQILRAAFPGLAMISGHRPGATTSTGNQSYHALNRAVDLPPRWDVFNWIREHYGRSTKELIFTPAGGLQIKNGKDHVYTGGTIQQDHYDHVHWAYDNGGYIPPGQVFQNTTNTSELALNAAQGRALEERIRNSDRPVSVTVYVDGVRRDAEIVWDEKADELARILGGAV